MSNIEIDPITGAPVIKPKEQPTVINPIMPVVAEPTTSPGLNTPAINKPAATTPVVIPAPKPFVAPTPAPMKVTADATVGEGDDKHVSTLYPQIRQILKEGGGDTQQQAQTFEKLKELLQTWAE